MKCIQIRSGKLPIERVDDEKAHILVAIMETHKYVPKHLYKAQKGEGE